MIKKFMKKIIIMLACFGMLFTPVHATVHGKYISSNSMLFIESDFTNDTVVNHNKHYFRVTGSDNIIGGNYYIVKDSMMFYVVIILNHKLSGTAYSYVNTSGNQESSFSYVNQYSKGYIYYADIYEESPSGSSMTADFTASFLGIDDSIYETIGGTELTGKPVTDTEATEKGLLINKSYNLKKGNSKSENVDTWNWNRSYNSNHKKWSDGTTISFRSVSVSWSNTSKDNLAGMAWSAGIVDTLNPSVFATGIDINTGKCSSTWSDEVKGLEFTANGQEYLSSFLQGGNYYYNGFRVQYQISYGDGSKSDWTYITNTAGASPKTSTAIQKNNTYNSEVVNNYQNITTGSGDSDISTSITYNNDNSTTNNTYITVTPNTSDTDKDTTDTNGSNLWDLLIQVVKSLGDVIVSAIGGLVTAFGDILDFLKNIFDWLAGLLQSLVVPSTDQWAEINTKKKEVVEKTGFIGQSTTIITDCLTQCSNSLTEGNIIFKWDNFSLFDNVIISAGSFDLVQFDSNSAFSAVHKTIKTVVDTFLILGVILLTYRKLKQVLYS